MENNKRSRGRPRFPDSERLMLRSLRINASQWQKIDFAGMPALRKLINLWQPKAKPDDAE